MDLEKFAEKCGVSSDAVLLSAFAIIGCIVVSVILIIIAAKK